MKKDNINSKVQIRNGEAAKLKEALLLRFFGLTMWNCPHTSVGSQNKIPFLNRKIRNLTLEVLRAGGSF